MGKHKGKRAAKGEAFAFEDTALPLADPAFAAWFGSLPPGQELVTPATVMGLSAVIRAVWIISTTIAGLPLRTFERQGDERVKVDSVFDDPYPGLDGQTPFAWVETILIHLLLWRDAFLWHGDPEDVDADGFVIRYRPLIPDYITKVHRVNGKLQYTYRDSDGLEQTVGTEAITHIPGPSMDTVRGHPFLRWARAIFSAAIAGDKAAQTTLSMGIRLAGLVTPGEGEDIDPAEGASIIATLRGDVLGNAHAGDIAFINRRLKLDPWTPSNVDSQWHETLTWVLSEMERLFGIPPHLMADTVKQTSWGTGVSEQNLGLARFTLTGWSTRVEQILTRTLPANQFCEFDYKGLLQGTPSDEIRLVLEELAAGLISLEYACQILNLPQPTPEMKAAQKARTAPPPAPPAAPTPMPMTPQGAAA